MRNRDQERQKPTAATVSFQDEEGRCLTPFTVILAHFAQKAKLAFPKANGRVERALEIVTDARNVIIAADYMTFHIKSQNGGGWYTVTDAGCECKDRQFNGGQPCKHIIGRWLVMRMQQAAGARRNGSAPRQWECSCVLPGQSCPTCEAAAREIYGEVL